MRKTYWYYLRAFYQKTVNFADFHGKFMQALNDVLNGRFFANSSCGMYAATENTESGEKEAPQNQGGKHHFLHRTDANLHHREVVSAVQEKSRRLCIMIRAEENTKENTREGKLPKGITRCKDGRYQARYTSDGHRYSLYGRDVEELALRLEQAKQQAEEKRQAGQQYREML